MIMIKVHLEMMTTVIIVITWDRLIDNNQLLLPNVITSTYNEVHVSVYNKKSRKYTGTILLASQSDYGQILNWTRCEQ